MNKLVAGSEVSEIEHGVELKDRELVINYSGIHIKLHVLLHLARSTYAV